MNHNLYVARSLPTWIYLVSAVIDIEHGETCTICNVSLYWSREQKSEQQNNAARHKTNGAAGYLGPVKIEP